jgi:hypothetical protein
MGFNIEEIRSNLTFGGARQAFFNVMIFNNLSPAMNIKTQFLVRASEIPQSTIGTISVPYFGRIVKYAGDRTFQPWQVTVINDEDFLIRNGLEEWSNRISGLQSNVRTAGPIPSTYKSQAVITQYGKSQNPLRQYTFNGLWPSEISTMTVDWNVTDQIQEFNCVFNYDYWTVSGGVTGNAGGTGV